jgi:membrane protein DedA with SNARE-associated domain
LTAVLALGSITGSLVTFATHAIGRLGLAGVGLLMLSTGVIFVPGTEPTMLFAGFNVYQHTLSLTGIIVAGLIGDVGGALIAYAIGRFGKEGWLQRRSARMHRHKIDQARRWFEQYGAPVLFISRMMPVVRSAFPYAAGIAEMPARRFAIFAALGSIPWVVGLAVLGREVGHAWQSWRHHLEYVDYIGIAIVVIGIAFLVVRRFRSRDTPQGASGTSQTGSGEIDFAE